jgi:hypothetical protein
MKVYKILTHYVLMEKYEIPESALTDLEELQDVEDYSLEDKLLMLAEEEYCVKTDSRDFEVVEMEIEEKEGE